MNRPNEKPRAPRLPKVEPLFTETKEQRDYNAAMRNLRGELSGVAPSWSLFFRQLLNMIAIRALWVAGALAGTYAFTRLVW